MKTNAQRLLGVLLVLAFGLLAAAVVTQNPIVHQLDAASFSALAKAQSPLNTGFFKLVAVLGSPAVAISGTLAVALWRWRQAQRQLAALLVGLQLLGSALTLLIKHVVARPRPLHQLVADTGFGFPSGHTFCTALFVFSLLLVVLPRLADQENQLIAILLGLVWIGLVAVSRVYLRDHDASDVLASLLLASGLWLLTVPSFERKSRS